MRQSYRYRAGSSCSNVKHQKEDCLGRLVGAFQNQSVRASHERLKSLHRVVRKTSAPPPPAKNKEKKKRTSISPSGDLVPLEVYVLFLLFFRNSVENSGIHYRAEWDIRATENSFNEEEDVKKTNKWKEILWMRVVKPSDPGIKFVFVFFFV